MSEEQDERSERERIYDDEIAPLMTKIFDVCKRAEIPFAAQFSIGPAPDGDESWLCTSGLSFGDEQIRKVMGVMKPPSRPFLAMTVMPAPRPDEQR